MIGALSFEVDCLFVAVGLSPYVAVGQICY